MAEGTLPTEENTSTSPPLQSHSAVEVTSLRSTLQTIARIISTDRRATILASENGDVLLANAAAQRVGIHEHLTDKLTAWSTHCLNARRAGTQTIQPELDDRSVEGLLVHLPLGSTEAYLIRLSETEQEAASLRNRARAATLLRVAHDLKTPIQSLLSAFEEWSNTTSTAPRTLHEDTRSDLDQTAQRALDQIDHVLSIIRSEQTPGQINPDEAFSLTDELKGLISMIRPIARSKETLLEYNQTPSADVWVSGPVRFVRALFQNMVDNSVKYGGPKVEIGLRCIEEPLDAEHADEAQQLRIRFEVGDWGGGLPVEQKARLLSALGHPYKSAASDTSPHRSSGLTIMLHALRQLGGTMEVLDRHANGTPAQMADDTPVAGTILRAEFSLLSATPPASRATRPHAPAYTAADMSLENHKIIVVEDSPASRDWLIQVLQRAGATVFAAGNGMEALELLSAPETSDDGLDPCRSILLTDMTLPYMSGLDLVRRLRAAQDAAECKWTGQIVGLTAHVDDQLRKACHESGFYRVLDKPIRASALIQTIKEAGRVAQTALSTANTQPHFLQTGDLLAQQVVADLLEQMGSASTQRFMKRALTEAEVIVGDLLENGATPDSRRQLHAATGACGLTGLSRAEKALRALELRLEEDRELNRDHLEDARSLLEATRHAIEELALA